MELRTPRSTCPICLKRCNDKTANHEACSREMQRRRAAEDSVPHKGRGGKIATTPDGAVVTEGQHRENVNRNAGRQYTRNQAYWGKFD